MAPPPPERLAGEVVHGPGIGPAGSSAALALGLATQVARRAVMASVEKITRRYFDGEIAEVRPADGFAVCAAFNASSKISARMRSAYEATMPERCQPAASVDGHMHPGG
jgi:hypothetical protein